MLGEFLDMFIPDTMSGGPLWNPLIIVLAVMLGCPCAAMVLYLLLGAK